MLTIEKINIIEWLPYIFLVLVIIIILIFSYIRIKYGFWVIQPVFHIYDIGYYLYPPGIISHYLPDKNKYTNFKNIETIVFSKLSDIKISQFVNFVNVNYLQNKDNVFCPKRENIVPYFTGHGTYSFVSFYTEDKLLIDIKNGDTIEDKQVVGLMTSRPLHVSINKNKNKDETFDAYYVDYLCVDLLKRKKGIAPQIIQTHNYNQNHTNKNIVVSLFKREDELTGIVPLCLYSTYGFPVTKWTKPISLSAIYTFLEISPQNFHKIYDFIKSRSTNSTFDIVINTDIPNIIELIKTKNIFINAIICDDEIICAYFFRKTCVFIEKDMEILSCFASINNCLVEDIFIQGFKISFWNIADKNNFGFCAIENISHNNVIITDIIKKTHPLIVSPTAYFFYNFAYHSFKPEKVFIIN
jgi:hypothetical protein